MMASARRRAATPVAGAGLLSLGLMLWSAGAATTASSVTPASTTTTTVPAAPAFATVPIKGEGSWGPYKEIVTWQNDLITSKHPVDLNYVKTGDLLGRQDFVSELTDFVISGPPFTPTDLGHLKGGAAGLIDAPIQVESLAFLLTPPYPDGFQWIKLLCDPTDPTIPDPSKCIQKHQYVGDIKVPPRNLAAMVVKYSGTGNLPLSAWNHPDVLAAMGVDNFTVAPDAKPAPVNRSDPSGTDYFLQQFIKQAAPDVWAGLQKEDPAIHWEPITERLARQGSASRQGVDQQSLTLGLGGVDPATGGLSGFTAGTLAPVPASAFAVVHQAFPKAPITFVKTKNAAGEWVGPTPDSISKAVAAGGDAPLYALTHNVPGAYPLAWVNHLYVPAKGLSIEKTEVLATMVRYLVTDGQKAARPVGEGALSPELVTKALAAADTIVSSNCVGADRAIQKDSTPGPYAPATADLAEVGPMLHCVAVVKPTTTTSTPTPVTTAPPATYDTTPLPATPTVPLPTPPVDTTPTSAAPTATTSPAKAPPIRVPVKGKPGSYYFTLASMPSPVPTVSGPGFDRFAALLVGVGAYLIAFNPVRSLIVRRRS
ncbi:MAG: pstS [Acidimicrobiales bacterium]|nr:pstS [Acidimicrobiales bacterium]